MMVHLSYFDMRFTEGGGPINPLASVYWFSSIPAGKGLIGMGLFTLDNCCASCSLDYLKSYLESKSRLSIPEFSGYYCM